MSDNATCLASVFPFHIALSHRLTYLHVFKNRGKNSHLPIASTRFFVTLIAGVRVQFSISFDINYSKNFV